MGWLGVLRSKAIRATCRCRSFDNSLSLIGLDHFRVVSKKLLGVTLSWSAQPVPYEESTLECTKCGRVWKRNGYLPRALWERTYPPDDTGWPMLDGERMALAPRD